ncbi:MAG: hypothetical protein KGK30_08440, partial [Elusimicrobia bacterium]|nr:hypothetical protein [Elusimicrobiota bacterium]
QKYKEELAAAEAAHILQQIAESEAELSRLDGESKPLAEALGARRAELSAEGATLAAHALDKANQQNQLIESNQRLAEVKAEAGRLEERLHSAEEAITQAEQRALQCEDELRQLSQRATAVAPEIKRSSEEAAAAEAAKTAAEAEAAGWHEQLAAVRGRLSEAEAGLERLRREALQAAEQGLAQRRKLSESESAWARQEMGARAALRELEKGLAQRASCDAELAAARAELDLRRRRVESARSELDRAEAEASGLRSRHAELGEETLRLHTDLARGKAQAESLEAQGGQNPYWIGAQACLEAGIPGVRGTVRQLFMLEEETYKPYLEDLLGERLYAVVCEDSTAARRCVELLEDSGRGRGRFLVLSALPELPADRGYPDEAKPLLARIRWDARDERAVRFLLGESYALGRTLFTDHWVYGGGSDHESLKLSLSDVQEVRAKVAAAEARAAEVAALRVRCGSDLEVAESRTRAAQQALTEESGTERSLAAQIAEKESSLALYAGDAELSLAEAA